jgi:hypothetical protein
MPLGSAPLPWGDAAEKRTAGETAGAISTEVAGLLRRHSGRGPTKARTIISSDLVVVTLSDCLTKAETEVAAAGHAQVVTRARSVLYDGYEPKPRQSSRSSPTAGSPRTSRLSTMSLSSRSSSSTSPPRR